MVRWGPRSAPLARSGGLTLLHTASHGAPGGPWSRRSDRKSTIHGRVDRLLLQLDLDAGRGEGELHALCRRREGHLDSLLILQRRDSYAAAHSCAGSGRHEVTGEVLDLPQV